MVRFVKNAFSQIIVSQAFINLPIRLKLPIYRYYE